MNEDRRGGRVEVWRKRRWETSFTYERSKDFALESSNWYEVRAVDQVWTWGIDGGKDHRLTGEKGRCAAVDWLELSMPRLSCLIDARLGVSISLFLCDFNKLPCASLCHTPAYSSYYTTRTLYTGLGFHLSHYQMIGLG